MSVNMKVVKLLINDQIARHLGRSVPTGMLGLDTRKGRHQSAHMEQ